VYTQKFKLVSIICRHCDRTMQWR